MCKTDDPLLALIARFVVEDIDNIKVSDEAFLQLQLTEMKKHLESGPKEQRQQLALAWITKHAEQYRNEWQRRTLSKMVLDRRCADCPLTKGGSSSYCAIHGRWALLLKEYMADQISSETYIEETLALLSQHKADLKISAMTAKMQAVSC